MPALQPPRGLGFCRSCSFLPVSGCPRPRLQELRRADPAPRLHPIDAADVVVDASAAVRAHHFPDELRVTESGLRVPAAIANVMLRPSGHHNPSCATALLSSTSWRSSVAAF